MSLELAEVVLQLERMALRLGRTGSGREQRLTSLLEAGALVDPGLARERTEAAVDRPYLAAVAEDGLVGPTLPGRCPPAGGWWR